MAPDPDPDSPPGTPPPQGLVRRALRAAGRHVRERLREDASRARARAAGAAGWAWARRPEPARAAAVALLAAVLGLGLAEVGLRARLPARLPTEVDWRAAAAILEREARPGDALAISPAWAERARLVAPARLPVLALARLAGEELPGVRRLWLLSLPDAPGHGSGAELDVIDRAARSEGPVRLGALELTRYDLAFPSRPLAFLPDRLAGAEVRLGEVSCPAAGDGSFACPAPAPARVRRTVREVAGAPRPCLSLELDPAAAAPLALAFRAVPMGRTLRGHAGLAGPPGARPAGPVRVSLLVDGEHAGEVELSPDTFHRFDLDTGRFAGSTRDLALVVTALDLPGALCLDAVTSP